MNASLSAALSRERERESKLTKTLWHIITELTKEMCVSRMPWSYMMEIDDFDKRELCIKHTQQTRQTFNKPQIIKKKYFSVCFDPL